ncbi:hypothetical protein [Halostella sp. PRR32]|uniref:hypothetical protein n=1 Tax=Halostella sp. PRR32 TaxID=3098147 RepID=UPI002B1CFFC3|nr:hypothetical protein [Halostella sp. PRR32]
MSSEKAVHHSAPGAAGLQEDQPVTVTLAGRTTTGTVVDIEWRPRFNYQAQTAVTVDVGETTVVAPPADVLPR